ncbi:MAG: FAD-binding oxidoreductase [Gammaproteobacteria bacterium]|nr:FAD-binding oxidoreductase [Gammaproteobacteria bacterium]
MLNIKHIKYFNKILPKNFVFSEPGDCWAYGYDNSKIHVLPECVLFANNKNQIQDIVKYCFINNIPITTRGRGTGNTGGSVPIGNSIVLSLEKMDKILKVDIDNRLSIVEPGVINKVLQDILKKQNFFWGPDPSSQEYSTIGGNIANNSAGPRAIKYGTPRDNILGLEFISGKGEIHKTGVKTSKGVVGLDLTRLFTGSEGVLGILTEATLKILPLNNIVKTIEITFENVENASDTIISLMTQPITPYKLEFIDNESIKLINTIKKNHYDKNCNSAVLLEIDGENEYIDIMLEKIIKVIKKNKYKKVTVAGNKQDIEELWSARKSLSPALREIGGYKINEDIAVPISNLTILLTNLNRLSEKYAIKIVNFGHAGNGNIHVNLLFKSDEEKKSENSKKCLEEIFNLVLSLDGTLSGEHGVGIIKKKFINKEIDKKTLSLMNDIKKQFDPNNIMNPNKSI